MPNLIVYRASAGSGKTYKITEEYLRLLYKNSKNFRRILAITFTNKAASEMKNRIIENLYLLSSGKHTGYSTVFKNEFGLSEQEIMEKARQSLLLILHNFSHFS